MRVVGVLCAVAFLGCGGGGGDDEHPLVPPVIPPHPDAPDLPDAPAVQIDAPPGTEVAGRVCKIVDLRSWYTNCAGSGAADLTVAMGSFSTTTAADGTFTAVVPSGVSTATVSGTGVVTSISSFDPAGDIILPAPTTGAWSAVLAGTVIEVGPDNGTILAELRVSGDPSADATLDTNPVPGALAGSRVYYDNDADKNAWGQIGTQGHGKALAADMLPTVVDLTETFGSTSVAGGVTVTADAITFVTLDLTP